MFENFKTSRGPMYDPVAVQPMRDELSYVGFEELLTPGEVDAAVRHRRENSRTGCGNAHCGVR